MVVHRILLSVALLCILPVPFSPLLTGSVPLVLGAPPLHLLNPHVQSSSSSSASSSLYQPSLSSSTSNRESTAARRSLKKRTTSPASSTIDVQFDPPTPPEDMPKFKKCFHECITAAQEMFPECKSAIPSDPPSQGERGGEEEDMTWHNLCPLASYVCLHSCKTQGVDWSQWMGAVEDALIAQQKSVKPSTRH